MMIVHQCAVLSLACHGSSIFDEELKVTVQQIGVGHKGLFERQDDLSSVAYWYQKEPHNVFSKLPEKEKRWPR